MTESDNTWNADDNRSEPEPPTTDTGALHPDFSWPQYTWPPPADAAAASTPEQEPTLPPSVPAAGTGSVSWPPTQPTVAPDPTVAYGPGRSGAGPYGAGPYGAGPYGASGANPPAGAEPGPWGAPLPGWSPAAPPSWPPTGPPPRQPTKARRGIAALAALALVLASAGVGAAVAVAVHRNSDTQAFSANGNGTTNGNGGFNGGTLPSGNGLGGGTFGGGAGDGGTGSIPGGSGSLDQAAIAAKVTPALVDINTTLAQGRAAGTGMLISSTGEILTNNHVIADATSIKVTIAGTGPTYNAKVVGYDVTEDVALVQITDKVSGLPTVTFGDPSKVQVGDPVVAIGNALGKGGTPSVSQGQVTRLDQQVTAGDGNGNQETLEGMIQINAPIQPGDSGGALVDSSGSIIGMNTAAAGGGQFNSQSGSNVGFAIPIDHAVSIVSQIRTGVETDKVHIGDRALLGVQVQDLDGQKRAGQLGSARGRRATEHRGRRRRHPDERRRRRSERPARNRLGVAAQPARQVPPRRLRQGGLGRPVGNPPRRQCEARRRSAALIDTGRASPTVMGPGLRWRSARRM